LAEKEGVTVLCGAAVLAGVFVEEVAGFAGVVEVEGFADAVVVGAVDHAARMEVDEMLR
jgi:hypothetical protein